MAKGYILIWAMFISLFMVSFFVAFQSSFLVYLNTLQMQSDNVTAEININNKLMSLSWGSVDNEEMWDIVINSETFSWNIYKWTLWYKEAAEYLITTTGGTNSLWISIDSGWSLTYEVITYPGYAVFDSGYLNSTSAATMLLDGTKEKNIIWIYNLGWQTKFSINRWDTDFVWYKTIYKVYNNFWSWKKFIKYAEKDNFEKYSLIEPPTEYKDFKVFINSTNYGSK